MSAPSSDSTPAAAGFLTLGLDPSVLRVLADVGYESPSPIQAATIPPLLEGRDVLGQAQTGTGKTAAFALPILSRITPRAGKPQALVLAPTRELAIQVAEAFQRYAAHIPGFQVLPIYGGQSYGPQLHSLKRGVHVVVGTPGRVIDHMDKGTLDLSELKYLVLDEADEMLRMGFIDDVEKVLQATPPERQVALFSATMPSVIRKIAQRHLKDPVEVIIKSSTSTAANIRQRYWFVSGMHKLDAMTRILEAEPFDAMIVFARTKSGTEELAEKLQAPIVMTEGARGAVPARHPLALSTLGSRCVLPHADVVLVAGSRFLDAVAKPVFASPDCQLIYLNIDEAAFAPPRQPGLNLQGDVRLGLQAIAAALDGRVQPASRADDVAKVKAWEDVQMDAVRPQSDYVAVLRDHIADDATLVSELTQVGYFSNIAYKVHASHGLVTPGFQGTLGYGFPTALGVAAGAPDKRTVSITGDGGFGWALQELATAAKYSFNLTTIVFADGRFGNVQRIQKRTFGRTFAVELQNPDFQLLAQAFGVRSERVNSPAGLAAALKAAEIAGGPSLIEVEVGEMPSPWALIHPFVPPLNPPPPNPLGEPNK